MCGEVVVGGQLKKRKSLCAYSAASKVMMRQRDMICVW